MLPAPQRKQTREMTEEHSQMLEPACLTTTTQHDINNACMEWKVNFTNKLTVLTNDF